MKKEKHKTFYTIVKNILMVIFKPLYMPTYMGLNNIPKNTNFILAGNHTSYLDCLFIAFSTKKMVHFLAKKELHDSFFGFFFRLAGTIPVDRSIHDKNAKTKAIETLENNQVIGIFPEGTINRTKEIIRPFKFGCVSMSQKAKTLIVPFSITGKYKLFRKNVIIAFGKPFMVNEKEDLELSNKHLENTVTELIKENTQKLV